MEDNKSNSLKDNVPVQNEDFPKIIEDESYTYEPVSLNDQVSEDEDNEILQYVRFKIITLNEEYKWYKINMKIRFHMCVAQIFIALISIFIGQLLSVAKHINTIDDIGKIGSVVSSIFVIAGTITTIFTVYLNNSSEKYFERSGNTEITERHGLFWVGEVWICCIILSKSFDLVNNLEYRLNQKYDISKYLIEDSLDSNVKEKELGCLFNIIKFVIKVFNLCFLPYYWLSGRIVFRDQTKQSSDEDQLPLRSNQSQTSKEEEQNPVLETYFKYFVVNNLELYPNEEFAIKSILNGAIITTGEGTKEKYDPEFIRKILRSKFHGKTIFI
ncbi:8243_t:CDS:2 [Dentiscutata erythropus]|uniref:8243_t:CDS:1 n=1 Tax=Dentiscutata erythropus TaxID=1348616 RepID=A0A9N9CJ05_9GLOM|nr:8243_t:CDS:2 [Dentiscutata erythropus]